MTLLIVAPLGTTEFQHHRLEQYFVPSFGEGALFDARRAAHLIGELAGPERAEILSSSRNLQILRALGAEHVGDSVRVAMITTNQAPASYSDTSALGQWFKIVVERVLPQASVHEVTLRCDPTNSESIRRGLDRTFSEPPIVDWWPDVTRVVVLMGSTPQIRSALDETLPIRVASAAPVVRARLERGAVRYTPIDAVDAMEPPVRALLQRVLRERLERLAQQLVETPEFAEAAGEELKERVRIALATPPGSSERRRLLHDLGCAP